MKKGTKLFTGILMSAIMLGTTTFASTQYFAFNLSPGVRESSSNASKSDAEQTAYVTTVTGDIGSADKVWYRVRYANETFATETKFINSKIKITLDYLSTVGAGGSYHLNGQQDSASPYNVNVIGQWTP